MTLRWCLHQEILYRMEQLLAVYLTEGILYVNDILLIDITNSIFVIYCIYIYIYIYVHFYLCSVITVIIAQAQYTIVLIFVIYDRIVFVVCGVGPFLLTCI